MANNYHTSMAQMKPHSSEIQGAFEIEDGGIQGITADDLRLCEEAFDLFDNDGSGRIDV